MENNREYFLRNLNFQSGFGVDLAMINYAPRNIFYKKCLKDIKGKTVLDVGSGTGILSVMAVDSGADKVYAFEIDKKNYELSKHLVETAGLSDKIKIFHNDFLECDNNLLDLGPIDVFMSETFANDVFIQNFSYISDHVYKKFNLSKQFVSIPQSIELKISVVDCGLLDGEFLPGIEINKKYKDAVDLAIQKYRNSYIPIGQKEYAKEVNTDQDINLLASRLTKKPIIQTESRHIETFDVDGNLQSQINAFEKIVDLPVEDYTNPKLRVDWFLNFADKSLQITGNVNTVWNILTYNFDKERNWKFKFRFNPWKNNLIVSQID